MITWIASYPKSGNTWARFLVHNALFEPTDDSLVVESRMRYVAGIRGSYRPEPGRDDIHKTHHALRDTHPYRAYTRRAIYIVRDPRDVLLSNMSFRHLRGGAGDEADAARAMTDEAYARAFIEHGGYPVWSGGEIGTWADNALSWTVDPGFPVLLVRYEDIAADPAARLAEMLGFIGRPAAPDAIERAVETSGLSTLRAAEIARRGEDDRPLFFNRGRSGQSLDELVAPGLDALFDERFAGTMARFGYAPRT